MLEGEEGGWSGWGSKLLHVPRHCQEIHPLADEYMPNPSPPPPPSTEQPSQPASQAREVLGPLGQPESGGGRLRQRFWVCKQVAVLEREGVLPGGFCRRWGLPGLTQWLDRMVWHDTLIFTLSYSRYQDGPARLGWLLDMNATTQVDEENRERSGLDLYFLQQVRKTGWGAPPWE